MPDLETKMRRELVRYLVQRYIFCPVTGEVLDIDKCVVLLDKDGDPTMVLSQTGWKRTTGDADKMAFLAKQNITIDESTVRP